MIFSRLSIAKGNFCRAGNQSLLLFSFLNFSVPFFRIFTLDFGWYYACDGTLIQNKLFWEDILIVLRGSVVHFLEVSLCRDLERGLHFFQLSIILTIFRYSLANEAKTKSQKPTPGARMFRPNPKTVPFFKRFFMSLWTSRAQSSSCVRSVLSLWFLLFFFYFLHWFSG